MILYTKISKIMVSAAVVSCISPHLAAQQATTISPSTGSSTTITQNGSTYSVDGGTTAGTNLFHTFDQFDVAAGDTASWTHSAGDASAYLNIINRVQGGEVSEIFGTLDASEFENADFYFINPAGVVFGATSSVNVPGGFHVTTADRINFSDGIVLAVDAPSGSTLSTAAPVSFGFLGSEQSEIQIAGARLTNFVSGAPVSFTSGEIKINNAARIDVSSGQLVIAGVTRADSFDFRSIKPDLTGSQLGNITIGGGARVFSDAVGDDAPGAFLSLTGHNIHLTEDAQVTSDNVSTLDGGSVVLQSTGNVRIDQSSILRANALRTGSAVGLDISLARTLTIDGTGTDTNNVTGISSSSQPRASVAMGGDAGNVTIKAGNLSVIGGGQIQSISFARGGDSGTISILADEVYLDGSGNTEILTLISNSLEPGSFGSANSIVLDVTDLTIGNGAQLLSSTFTEEDGGEIRIDSSGDVLINGLDEPGATGVLAQSEAGASGSGGNIRIIGNNLSIQNGGDVSVESQSFGGSGTILIDLTGDLLISGSPNRSTGIFAQIGINSSGSLGSIDITADNIFLLEDAAVSALTRSQSSNMQSESSLIRITSSGRLAIESGSLVTTESRGPQSSGEIDISMNELTIDGEGSRISSVNSSVGLAGQIRIEGNTVALTNSGTIITSSESGNAGTIEIDSSEELSLSGSSAIQSESNTGAAGAITLTSLSDIELKSGSIVSTNSAGSFAGDIVINIGAGKFLILQNAQITTSGVRGLSDVTTGGRIFVASANQDAPLGGVVLFDSVLEALGDGSGALLSIDRRGTLIRDQQSVIAVSGTVESPDNESSDQQESLEDDFLNAADVLSSQCLTQRGGEASTLTVPPSMAGRTRGDVKSNLFSFDAEISSQNVISASSDNQLARTCS